MEHGATIVTKVTSIVDSVAVIIREAIAPFALAGVGAASATVAVELGLVVEGGHAGLRLIHHRVEAHVTNHLSAAGGRGREDLDPYVGDRTVRVHVAEDLVSLN